MAAFTMSAGKIVRASVVPVAWINQKVDRDDPSHNPIKKAVMYFSPE